MPFGRDGLSGLHTGQRAARPMSDINVTPLVDVMLVLLVIFIMAAPLMASALKLELPKSQAAQPLDAPRFVSLSVAADGLLLLNEQPVPDDSTLAQRLRDVGAQNAGADTELQLRADRSVPYGRIVELMGLAHAAGLARIGFVTEGPAGP